MSRVLAYSVIAVAAAALLTTSARPAAAQVYPERITIAAKARAVAASGYQRRADNREEQTDRQTRTLKLGANGVLALGNIAGDIVITRANGSETTVEIVKTARGGDVNGAREQRALGPVEMREPPGRADIRAHCPSGEEARRPNRRNFSTTVNYNVT